MSTRLLRRQIPNLVFTGPGRRTMVTGEKKILRKSMKATLSNLSEEEISRQSQLAQDLIINLPQYKNATRISVFLSMPKAEAQTDLIVQDALKLGKETFVPYIHRPPKSEDGERKKRSVIEMLRLASVEEYEGLERDSWGIPRLPTQGLDMRENARGSRGIESAETDDEGGLVLVVVPGVAFDAGLNRLGHGAGFYDEFLTRFCAGGKRQRPFLVGLCLAEQYLPGTQIPTSEHDWRVDAVAVGNGTLVTSQSA